MRLVEPRRGPHEESRATLASTIVKEMYDKENNLAGWAAMVKTHDESKGGEGWFWYEGTSTTDKSQIAAVGNGVPGCQSCHTIGLDMVRSNVREIQ